MAFVVPNAIDTSGANRFAAIDQAEPDSLDFEILGNNSSGVITGCEVSALTNPTSSVKVSAGWIVINNVAYQIANNDGLVLPTAPVNNRFDLVIARVSGATASYQVITGTDSDTNPTFPISASRMSASDLQTYPTSIYINFATDVVLAAVYRSGGASITNARIVDKRASVKSGVQFQGTDAPDAGVGVNGDLYMRTANLVSSGVYVKNSGAWSELAKYPVDPGVPIGSLMMWPTTVTNPNSSIWIEANGAEVSRSGVYAPLFGVYGTTYGSTSGTTFKLPDFRGFYLAGLPQTGATVGTQYGTTGNQVTLTTANLPSHNHSLTGATVDTAANHTHSMTHNHYYQTSSATDNHTHSVTGSTTGQTIQVYQNIISAAPAGVAGFLTKGGDGAGILSGANILSHSHSVTGSTSPATSTHTHSGYTQDAAGTTSAANSSHIHSGFTQDAGGTSSPAGSHGHTLTGNTANTGSASPVNITPATYYVRYFIRYA